MFTCVCVYVCVFRLVLMGVAVETVKFPSNEVVVVLVARVVL